MERIFNDHMATPEAQDELAKAAVIVMEKPSALLCFESCADGCHRRIVADLIRSTTGCTVEHLQAAP